MIIACAHEAGVYKEFLEGSNIDVEHDDNDAESHWQGVVKSER